MTLFGCTSDPIPYVLLIYNSKYPYGAFQLWELNTRTYAYGPLLNNSNWARCVTHIPLFRSIDKLGDTLSENLHRSDICACVYSVRPTTHADLSKKEKELVDKG
jgi:hypothetical protein